VPLTIAQLLRAFAHSLRYVTFGDVIVSMLATIGAQDSIKISKDAKAALSKKVAGRQLGALTKSHARAAQSRRLKVGSLSNARISKALSISASTVANYLL
jgi:hypothetical protein